MVSISQLISYGNEKLKFVSENPRIEARILLADILSLSPSDLFLRLEELVSDDKSQLFKEYVKLRESHMPIAYIIRKKDFYGLTFIVTEDTLIPRPETEFVVDEILSDDCRTLLDLCTGSGCIPVAVTKNSEITALGVDISDGAISVAEQNAENYGLSDKVKFEVCDIFKKERFGKFDVISSNPPYITEEDMLSLEPDVASFEPHTALNGGYDGLNFYRHIIKIAPPNLNSGGRLIFELGIGQSGAVKELMEEKFTDIKIIKDLAGIDRVISGRIK